MLIALYITLLRCLALVHYLGSYELFCTLLPLYVCSNGQGSASDLPSLSVPKTSTDWGLHLSLYSTPDA